MKNSIVELFIRDLNRLQKEIELYTDDEILWKVDHDVKNSGGNLAIHLIGNLHHFIGAVLGNSSYIRQRDKEFNDKNIPRKIIFDQIDEMKPMLEKVILNLTEYELQKIYPIDIGKEGVTTQQFLIHLYGHLNYHLGQINYHRRLLDNC